VTLQQQLEAVQEEIRQKSDLLQKTQAREVEYWQRVRELEAQVEALEKREIPVLPKGKIEAGHIENMLQILRGRLHDMGWSVYLTTIPKDEVEKLRFDQGRVERMAEYIDLAHAELDRAEVPRYDEGNAYLHLAARMKLVASSLTVFRCRIPDIETLLNQMKSDLEFEWIKAAGQKLIQEHSND
jgi:hypothetical protein